MRIAQNILLLLVFSLAALNLNINSIFAENAAAGDFYEKGKELYYSGAEGMMPEKDKAIENLEKAVQLDPALVDAHMLLGDAYWDKSFAYKSTATDSKKWQERAEIEYRKAVALDSQNPETYYKLLTVLNDAEREAVLSRIIKLDPNHPRAHEVLARILDHKGNVDQAILEYQKHI
jgi:Tfp pilus assembly protein PilF